jgi:hypothetical protein
VVTCPGYRYYNTSVAVQDTDKNLGDIALMLVSADKDIALPPNATALKGNYPNPFNPSTTVAFDLAEPSIVSIDIFNLKGQKVKTLANKHFSAGTHTLVWNGADNEGVPVGSGIYFYRMTTENYSSIKRMMLLK